MSSLITAAHNTQLHSPRLHKHLMKSIINNDQFYARFTYDQVMEHHDWFDGSDERGEPVYFLLATVKKAMSSAIPTEKQLNAHLYGTRASSTKYSQPGNSAFARRTRKQTEKKKCASEPGLCRQEAICVPVAAYTTQSSQVGDTGHQLPRTSV